MSKKIYHVWNYIDGSERYLGSFTSIKKAKAFAINSHEENKNKVGYTETVLSLYNLKNHEHWDIWYSFLNKENKEENK